MQLVVMAAVLVLAGAWPGPGAGPGPVCDFGCRPENVSLTVESCGRAEQVLTTVCEGRCYQEDPVYIGPDYWPRQTICSGDWSYEVKHIKGCPVAVSYPMARSCTCAPCETTNTYCGRFPVDLPSCLSK